MIFARPTVAQERWLTVASRYPALRAVIDPDDTGGWKTTTWLGRCLGVVLALVGVGMLAGVLSQLPSPLMIGGILLVILAEWLVAWRRVYRSGIEEAVYLCGAVAIVLQLLEWSDGPSEALGVGLVATAVLLVGWRLLNPVFTTLAAAGYSLAIALVGGNFLGNGMNTLEAGIACATVALLALGAGGREWRRPAHDRMLAGLIIVMPWLAHAWLTAYGWQASTLRIAGVLALAAAFFVINLSVGTKRRQHAPLVGALGNLVCVTYALHQLMAWPLHWKLIAGGGVLLMVTMSLEHALRRAKQGFTSQVIDEPAGVDLMQLAMAASIAPAPGAAPADAVQGRGGEFGGGGASGRY